VNVLLIPAGLDCRASLAADCSGRRSRRRPVQRHLGRELVPPPDALHPAFELTLSWRRTRPTEPRIRTCQRPGLVAEFYLAIWRTLSLAAWRTCILALCDLLQDGALRSSGLGSLAESQSVAVDFPKTGIVPQKALEKVQDEGYPGLHGRSRPAKRLISLRSCWGSMLYRRLCLTYALDWDLLEQAVGSQQAPSLTLRTTRFSPGLAGRKFASKARIELARYQMG
uniref:Uncharacterized protein n=1 Tax=Macrostomum lignano TaxID=282301 RepID=A0A1I8FDM9_9PLAT